MRPPTSSTICSVGRARAALEPADRRVVEPDRGQHAADRAAVVDHVRAPSDGRVGTRCFAGDDPTASDERHAVDARDPRERLAVATPERAHDGLVGGAPACERFGCLDRLDETAGGRLGDGGEPAVRRPPLPGAGLAGDQRYPETEHEQEHIARSVASPLRIPPTRTAAGDRRSACRGACPSRLVVHAPEASQQRTARRRACAPLATLFGTCPVCARSARTARRTRPWRWAASPVPLVRPRLPGRARPRAAGLGGGRRADGGGRAPALPYPETGVIEEDSIRAQSLALAAELPGPAARPRRLLLLAHRRRRGALAAPRPDGARLARRARRPEHPETSPSGNAWGMPLRMLIDAGTVGADDVALLGARNLDPPEEEFIASSGVHTGAEAVDRVIDGCLVRLRRARRRLARLERGALVHARARRA